MESDRVGDGVLFKNLRVTFCDPGFCSGKSPGSYCDLGQGECLIAGFSWKSKLRSTRELPLLAYPSPRSYFSACNDNEDILRNAMWKTDAMDEAKMLRSMKGR